MRLNGTSETHASAIDRMNALGAARCPFLFLIDYEMKLPLFYPLDKIPEDEILYNINGCTNRYKSIVSAPDAVSLRKEPVTFGEYQQAFDKVMAELNYGNSFLLNLTFTTPIHLNFTLREVFELSKAKYKVCLPDQFVVFSPETFVKIRKGRISSYPMKGTIDASITNATERILNNPKEAAEHTTIVDLIRNDLSRVASDVRVDRFRYVEEVKTHHKTLLQVSSEISGALTSDFHRRIGDIIFSLLPAGSISGAPKPKTVEILKNAEQRSRGYFTGVVGIFDGTDIDSGVMIRFIEKQGEQLVFKSGGGITTQSIAKEEYQEMLDKVYVPIH